MTFEGKHSDLTEKILGAFYTVYNRLGYGFSEKVYENALLIELKKQKLDVSQQTPIHVFYEDEIIGEYIADLLVDGAIIIEVKSVRQIVSEYEAQLLNYLKCTHIEVGLLLNFGPKAEFKRKLLDNTRKGSMSWIKDETLPKS